MSTNPVKISVIIPSRNRRNTLIQVLHALEDQDFPKTLFEVIVIDDCSTDGTSEFLNAYKGQTVLNLRYFVGPSKTAGAARNVALSHARGRLVLFLDSDTIPKSNVLSQHMLWHEHYGGRTCVLGRVLMSEKLEKRQQGRLNDTHTKYDEQDIAEIRWQEYRTANTSMLRETCQLVGGFDEELPAAEDTEFASRLSFLRMRFIFVADIQVVHHHPITPSGFFNKGSMYGEAVALWYKKSPELRHTLISRYGVFAPEMTRVKKIKYIVRALVINRLTVPLISASGHVMRAIWFECSDMLYVSVFRYHVRKAFRTRLMFDQKGF